MGPTWVLAGAERTQVGPMLEPWTLLFGMVPDVLCFVVIRSWWALLMSFIITQLVLELSCNYSIVSQTPCPERCSIIHVEFSINVKITTTNRIHEEVMVWKLLRYYWPFVREAHTLSMDPLKRTIRRSIGRVYSNVYVLLWNHRN